MTLTATDVLTDDTLQGDRKKVQEQSFWRRYFSFYDTLNESIPYQRMVARHVQVLGIRPGDFVLDAGTGTGNVAVALSQAGARVMGVDFLETALEVCRRKLPAAEFRVADLSKQLEFPANYFDAITCCNVLYILPPEAQENAVRELFRVLKPGASAAMTVFGAGFNTFKIYVDTMRQQRRHMSLWGTLLFALRYSIASARIIYYVARIKRRQASGDYTFFRREHFSRLLEGAGFRVRFIEPTLSGQCLLAFVQKPD